MLVKMPRGPVDETKASVHEERDPFEAALRRDLASTPVISYESLIGGWSKRAFDLAVILFTAPLWLIALPVAGLVARLRHRERVFYGDERIGYGGRAYRCLYLRLNPPVADVLVLHPGSAANVAPRTATPHGVWRRGLERLPQVLNVLRGEMSLVGPAPLTRAELEPLRTARRHYLSARPGIVGISALVDESGEPTSQYRVYSLCWSLATDLNLLLRALRGPAERARNEESA